MHFHKILNSQEAALQRTAARLQTQSPSTVAIRTEAQQALDDQQQQTLSEQAETASDSLRKPALDELNGDERGQREQRSELEANAERKYHSVWQESQAENHTESVQAHLLRQELHNGQERADTWEMEHESE